MAARGPLVLVLAGVLASMGASYRTTNFVVEAQTPQLAQQAGQYAEHWRKQKALEWLGQEMPQWPEPCPLKVTVTMSGPGGATSFAFDRGRVLGQTMHVEGPAERLMNSVLPHEVTHTVFAHYFRCPVPRWADEGGAVFSEDDIERNRHDMLCRQILNSGRAIPLRRLFALKEYPGDVMALYAEGYSVTAFLVGSSNRQQFLGFVASGMREGWDRAAQSYYRYQSVEELEQAWLNNLRSTKRPPAELARNTRPADGDSAAAKLVVRQTVPPAQPFDEPRQPIFRGKAPEEERAFESGGWSGRPARLPATDPGKQTASSPAPPPDPPPGVRLMAPEYGPPAVQMGQPLPGPVSPVGYPR
jgi:hypothetical protein